MRSLILEGIKEMLREDAQKPSGKPVKPRRIPSNRPGEKTGE
jgi:hypothetical protein